MYIGFVCTDAYPVYSGENYPGYKAVNNATGNEMAIVAELDAHVNISIPAGFQGDILIDYKGMWYWNIAYVISALSVCGCIVLGWREGLIRRKRITASN